MSTFNSKICILGDFAVGKTSTVERFINNQFSDKYLTTIGVKVDTKVVRLNDIDLKMIIWDIAGTDKFGEVELSYLQGASGYILVADGTQIRTLESAAALRKQLEERNGQIPFVYLINKCDLQHDWAISDVQLESLKTTFHEVFVTSAKSGQDVERAMTRLAKLVAAREFDWSE